ncbi:MAG: metal ABC transporter permease [Bacteroidales bacterium]|nr:metal ABC transporter permease [Bacteroidales bacterium]
MSVAQLEIQIIAVIVAIACALPGVFLVLRKRAMISDAISHAILPGIVIGFFLTGDLSSPFLVLLAAATGVLTVSLVEVIDRTGLVKEDTSIGLVFPALFSIGVILISRYAGDVHLDTGAVLLGELAFAPFDRLIINGIDMGPKALYVMGGILLINFLFISVFFKELKISTFDVGLATTLGFTPMVLHYLLMSIVSITAVGAFDAVGSILVVALMIVPAATAYLLTDDLRTLLILSGLAGLISALAGYWIAHWLDASIAGSMATVVGLLFLLTYLFAPGRGIYFIIRRRKRQKYEFAQMTLTVHIMNHSGEYDNIEERRMDHFQHHFNWDLEQARTIVKQALRNKFIQLDGDLISLTNRGLRFARASQSLIMAEKDPNINEFRKQFVTFNE